MKAAEIKLDGTEYRVSDKGVSVRVRPLEIRVPEAHEHRVHTGARWDFTGHTPQVKMVRCQVLRSHDGEERDIRWFALTQVECEWAAHVAYTESKRAREDAIEQTYANLEARWAGHDLPPIHISRQDGVARVSATTLRKLLDMLADA